MFIKDVILSISGVYFLILCTKNISFTISEQFCCWSGYSAGGTQIQPFRSAGLMNFGFNNNVTLVHNTYIYVTAIATNAAGLRGISYSDPILVDLTPPNIKFVYDGRGK